MIATLAWKEYREHRSIWIAMACFAVLSIVGMSGAMAAEGKSWSPEGIGVFATASASIIAIAYGLVCGAMMLAGEREAGTLTFLDTLTGRRTPLWSTKLVTGAALTTAQALLITAVLLAVASLANRSWLEQALWFFPIALVALEAFVWGLFFSALCRSALLAAGLAALALASILFLTGFSFVLLKHYATMATAIHAGLTAVALWASWRCFHREGFIRKTDFHPRSDWRTLLWLTYRQGRVLILGMAVVGFLAGLALPWSGLVVWPVVTLLTGIACGTAVFAGEQLEGSHRFLGEQRLPAGRVWAMKSAIWLAVGAGVAFLVLLGGMVYVEIADEIHPPSLSEVERPFLNRVLGNGRALFGNVTGYLPTETVFPPTVYPAFLTLWLLHGFGIAQVLTLALRKSAVAVVVAVMVSVVVVSLWVPTLVSGGLALWQVLGAPILLLAATRLVVWPWVSQRLYTAKPVAGLIGGIILAACWIVGVLAYRVLEVPDVGEPFDLKAFEASLPTPEQNEAGRLIRGAAKALQEHQRLVNKEFSDQERDVQGSPLPTGSLWERLGQTLDYGWPAKSGTLDQWLDRLFAGGWADTFRQAAPLPLGVIDDPRGLNTSSMLPALQPCGEAAQYFSARALQLQARGDPRAALDHLAVALAISRQVRNRSVLISYLVGQRAETLALKGFDQWLDKLGPRPKLLRRVLDELNRHEALIPPVADSMKAEYLMMHNTFDDPSSWIFRGSGGHNRWLELMVLAWQAPWEHERRMRIVNAVYAGWLRSAEMVPWQLAALTETDRLKSIRRRDDDDFKDWLPPVQGPAASLTRARLVRFIEGEWLLQQWMGNNMRYGRILSLGKPLADCRVRAVRLTVALALYQVENGKPAGRLEDLVPHYLAALPVDPFNGQPFHYRVSQGERIVWLPNHYAAAENVEEISRNVPAGQGILWSVGPDRTDNGGKRRYNENYTVDAEMGRDIIFLVPYWHEPRKGK